MSILIYSHEDCMLHEMGKGHPESPLRISLIKKALMKAPFAQSLVWKEAPLVEKSHLLRVHGADYIEQIFSLSPKRGYVSLDPDTMMNPYTLQAARRAAGAVVASVDAVFNGETSRAFCMVRPPGHHAEKNKAMGFCFFNNVAVGVAHALEKYGCSRIAIVDFDLHHGNGTDDIFFAEPRVIFWSSFQYPFYPGVSLSHTRPNLILSPLAAGCGSEDFRKVVTNTLLPLLEQSKPECIFFSAGFDAHFSDPLGNLRLQNEDYAFITQEVVKIAQKYASSRIISVLEGGYHLSLGEAAAAHVGALIF